MEPCPQIGAHSHCARAEQGSLLTVSDSFSAHILAAALNLIKVFFSSNFTFFILSIHLFLFFTEPDKGSEQ